MSDSLTSNTRAGLLRAKQVIEQQDTFTEPGGTGAGLLMAEVSTEYVNAYRDQIIDLIDAEIERSAEPPVDPLLIEVLAFLKAKSPGPACDCCEELRAIIAKLEQHTTVTKSGNQAGSSSSGDAVLTPTPRGSLPNSLGASPLVEKSVSAIDHAQRAGHTKECSGCDGTGTHVFPFSTVECKCSRCDGTGVVRVAVEKSEPATWMPPCPVCKQPDCRRTFEECTAGETSAALCEHGFERGACIIPSCEYR